MTDADKYFMVDVDDKYLNAFLRWYDEAREAGKLDPFTTYSVLKMAFSAGRNSQPDAPYAPSRDVLPPAAPQKRLMTYPERPYDGLRPVGRQQAAYWSGPEPDPFARVRLSGPQQAAMERFFPEEPATTHLWDGQVPETRPQRVLPADMRVSGPLEALPDEHPAIQYRTQRGDSG